MPVRSILLRVILCLVLAVNGVSSVSAAVHMPHGMPAEETAQQSAEVMNEMAGLPCHTSGSDDVAGDKERLGDEAGTEQEQPDCCKGSCQCACVQSVANAVIPMSVVPFEYSAQRVSVRDTVAHATPVLPHLIRPPIG